MNASSLAGFGWLSLAGWTAIVVVWISTILALAVAARDAWSLATPSARHRRAIGAMLLTVLLALATPWVLTHPSLPRPRSSPAAARTQAVGAPLPGATTRPVGTSAVALPPATHRAAPWIGAAWLIGSLFAAIRLVVGLFAVSWVRRRAWPTVSSDASAVTSHASLVWPIAAPDILASRHVQAPVAMGILKPAVVLPDEARHLPADVIAPLIAHELAHIVRRDYLVNLFQSLSTGLLFFAPGMHFLSRVARDAREFCCDDLAVDLCGGVRTYAHALVRIAETPPIPHARLALGAAGPSLVVRIRRLLQEDTMTRHTHSRFIGIAAALVGVAFTGSIVFAAAREGATTQQIQIPPAVSQMRIASFAPTPLPGGFTTATGTAPVVVRVQVASDGAPTSAEFLAGDAALTDAAIGCAMGLRFPPAEQSSVQVVGLTLGTEINDQTPSLQPGRTVAPPTRIAHVPPAYPQAARDARIAGVVIVEARVNAQGIVEHARILRSIPLLDEAALMAVLQWRYTPTLLNGTPTPVSLVSTINFMPN